MNTVNSFNRDQFTHVFESLMYVADASDLRVGSPTAVITIDGFTFESIGAETEDNAAFGDVISWMFRPTLKTIARRAAFAGYVIAIYND